MKRLFLILFSLLLFSAAAIAQEIKVLSVEAIPNDLQARTEARRDNNKVMCALLKVQLPGVEGLLFNEKAIIGDVSYKAGVYLVYVPENTKRLGYSHDKFYSGTIDFEALGVKIESGVTYAVKLQAIRPDVITPVNDPLKEDVEKPVTVPEPRTEVIATPIVTPSAKPMIFAMPVAGYAIGSGELSFGAMAGYVDKIGGYAKFRSNFKSVDASLEVGTDGQLSGGNGAIWASGETARTRMNVTAGALFRIANSIYPYAGVGFGSRNVYWETTGGSWAMVPEYAAKGVALELGTVMRLGPVALSVGVNCTAFKYTDVDFGVGFSF